MLRHFEGLLFMVLSPYNDEKVASSEKKTYPIHD